MTNETGAAHFRLLIEARDALNAHVIHGAPIYSNVGGCSDCRNLVEDLDAAIAEYVGRPSSGQQR